jgi:hypothetical protein
VIGGFELLGMGEVDFRPRPHWLLEQGVAI